MITLSEIYQRQIAYDIICIWNLIKMMEMNLFTKQRHSDFKIKFMVIKGETWGKVINWKIETNIYILFTI